MISLKSRTFKRFVSLCVAVCLFCGTFAVPKNQNVGAKTIKELQDQLANIEKNIGNLEKESEEVNTEISGLKGKIKEEEQKQKLLKKQEKNASDQVVLFENKISIVEDSIAQNKKEITAKTKSIEKNEKLFLKRVRAMYMSSQNSVMTIMLGVENLSDFLTRAEVLKRVSEHDTNLIDTLTKEKEDLLELKKQLLDKKSDLVATKEKYAKKSKELQTLAKFSEQSQEELEKLQKAYVLERERLADEIKASDDKIDAILADILRKQKEEEERIAREKAAAEEAARLEAERNQQNNNNNGGDNTVTTPTTPLPEGAFAWPVPGYSGISSGYGYRTMWGRKEFHAAIDIPAPSGTSIVASKSGTVVLAGYSAGYGNYVVVDHGGGYMTLYAHASSLDVSAGQQVSRGQRIAGVGTTGPSTGNHLHFEVRVNGAKQNPLNYVSR